MQLRNGSTTDDPRLDRLIQFDERSTSFPIRMLVEAKKPRSYTWRCNSWLDQGREGACVGFSWSHELAARPVELAVDAGYARRLYHDAQRIDEWPGGSYPGARPVYEGTSVLAGAKVLRRVGRIPEYRWAFGLQDLILAVGYQGPAVIGVNWYEGMFKPGPDRFLRVTGDLAGGHAITVIGVSIPRRAFLLHNSWGRGWGWNGRAYLSWTDMERLLHEGGEACIPTVRGRNPN